MYKKRKIRKENLSKNNYANGIKIAKYFSYLSLGVNYGFK